MIDATSGDIVLTSTSEDDVTLRAQPHQCAGLEPLQVEGGHVELTMQLRVGGQHDLEAAIAAGASVPKPPVEGGLLIVMSTTSGTFLCATCACRRRGP